MDNPSMRDSVLRREMLSDQVPIMYCTISQQLILQKIKDKIQAFKQCRDLIQKIASAELDMVIRQLARMLAPSHQYLKAVDFKFRLLSFTNPTSKMQIVMSEDYKNNLSNAVLSLTTSNREVEPPLLTSIDGLLQKELTNPQQYLMKVKKSRSSPSEKQSFDVTSTNFTLISKIYKSNVEEFSPSVERLINLQKDRNESFRLITNFLQMEPIIMQKLALLMYVNEMVAQLRRKTYNYSQKSNQYKQNHIKQNKSHPPMKIELENNYRNARTDQPQAQKYPQENGRYPPAIVQPPRPYTDQKQKRMH